MHCVAAKASRSLSKAWGLHVAASAGSASIAAQVLVGVEGITSASPRPFEAHNRCCCPVCGRAQQEVLLLQQVVDHRQLRASSGASLRPANRFVPRRRLAGYLYTEPAAAMFLERPVTSRCHRTFHDGGRGHLRLPASHWRGRATPTCTAVEQHGWRESVHETAVSGQVSSAVSFSAVLHSTCLSCCWHFHECRAARHLPACGEVWVLETI